MLRRTSIVALTSLSLSYLASAQTFQRLGACPSLGCVFPPDRTDFLPGQLFDIRLEVHAPLNGTEAYNSGNPDENFQFCIQAGDNDDCVEPSQFFGEQLKDSSEPQLETWTFDYYEDLFAQDSGAFTRVNVASKAYRGLSISKPGTYYAKLSYYGTMQTVAQWRVRNIRSRRKAKNAIFFIGDGMTQNMITAARLIGHKTINGEYQSLMQLDTMEALGLQMTHSIDSFITDSANSATALYSGKKTTVNALNVYADSSEDPFDDPKFETMFELFKRKHGGQVGVVSTANIQDATPAAQCTHTRDRGQAAAIVHEFLHGAESYTPHLQWPTSCEGPDVMFGGGAEYFFPDENLSLNGTNYYEEYAKNGYQVVYDKDEMQNANEDEKVLGIFTTSVLAKWLDRNVYTENLDVAETSPRGDGSAATNQPGLKDMTLKAIDVLHNRSKKGRGSNGGQRHRDKGFFMMAEAASIDKMMHALDYDRALGDLLELDDTVRATLEHLKELGIDRDTLVVVTADHGHGFDVYGNADTQYLAAQEGDRKKRSAVGIYANSGLSGYQVAAGSLPNNQTIVVGDQGPNFPVTWNPRYAYAAGFGAAPDHSEGFTVNTGGPRQPTTRGSDGGYVSNPEDQSQGFETTGTLPTSASSGVHSLTDVTVFASGPGSELFRGVYNSPDIFFKFAEALDLAM